MGNAATMSLLLARLVSGIYTFLHVAPECIAAAIYLWPAVHPDSMTATVQREHNDWHGWHICLHFENLWKMEKYLQPSCLCQVIWVPYL